MTNDEILAQYGPRESMEYDVVIVGAGPAGLSCAIRLKQLAAEKNTDISVVVLEKGSEPGAHTMAGTIIDPIALNELIPDWQEKGAPLNQAVTGDQVLFLSEKSALRTPNMVLPKCFHNDGCYVVGLGNVVRWLAQQAEALGVEIFPGFAAAEILYDESGSVKGIATGNMGVNKEGGPTAEFQLGMELHGKYTIFSEGSRGHLGKQLIARYELDKGRDPQSYGLGIKEIWEVDPQVHTPGLVIHTAGWPLDNSTYGGGFIYHMQDNKIALGLVTGLNYQNPYLSPFEEFQRWKTHPELRKYLAGDASKGIAHGKRIAYGARALTAGGLLSLPRTVFPGGALIGCDAGFLVASRIKGTHTAIKSGMLAAESLHAAVAAGRQRDELADFPAAVEKSWIHDDLYRSRNFKSWFKYGTTIASLMNGFEQLVFNGKAPWTLHRDKPDHAYLKPASECTPITYSKPDNKLTFDRLSSVFLASVNHAEDQPSHLRLKDPAVAISVNFARYAGPEARYCPAGVYEFVHEDDQEKLTINAQNCVHCKTCDIKDPTQNITWVTPEGGGGPNYSGM